jgi:hypothetical protein
MRFAHVDGEKIGVILIVFVNLHHVANLAPERRSRVAPEHNYQRTRSGALPDMKPAAAVQRQQRSVRRIVSDA